MFYIHKIITIIKNINVQKMALWTLENIYSFHWFIVLCISKRSVLFNVILKYKYKLFLKLL